MTTKFKIKNRFLSMLLASVLVFSMIPMTSMTAYAATPSEATTLNDSASSTKFQYSNNIEKYYKYNNYLYKLNFKNLKNITQICLAYISPNKPYLVICKDSAYIYLVKEANKYANNDTKQTLNNLPTQTGNSVSYYMAMESHDYANNMSNPVVTITCMGVGNPTWTWNGTSSATAKFTSTDNGATLTVNASITSSTQAATSCVNKEKITYTAKATANGNEYTDTRIVDGAAGPHSLTYTASGNVITETCKNNCGHKQTATLKVKNGADLSYTGSAITPLMVEYSSDWQGAKDLSITYSSNINVGQGSGSITIGGTKATQNFTITNGTMTNITADKVSVPYDGNSHGITVKNVPTGATVSYSTDGKTYTANNPAFTDIGANTVYYKVEKDNYNTVTGSATVTISQAQNCWNTEPSIEGWTYGQTANTPNKGTPKFGSVTKVEYKPATADDSEYSKTVPTQAGSYKARFTVEGNANYTALSKEVEFEIEKVKLTVKADDKSKTYGEQDPTLTCKITSGALVGDDTLTDISVTRTTGEDVKTYTITASQTEGANPNYEITFVDGTFTIYKKTLGISWGNRDFTYDGGTKCPTATATGMAFNDEIELTVTGDQINAGTGYTATVTGITGDKKDNYRLPADVTTTFNIAKANQTAPSGLDYKAETIDGKADGYIKNLTDKMEYRKDSEQTYTAIIGTELTNLADGTYYIRYKEDKNHNASPDITVVLSNDTKLTVTVPTTQTGYTLTVSNSALKWNESTTITFALSEGYSKLNNFAVKVNGKPIELDNNGKYTVANVQENLTVTVEGVADITAPDTEIILGTNKWNKFFNNITFGLFFKDTQKVTVTASDKGSGLDKIYYYLATEELTEEQVKELSSNTWTEYKGEFNINPQDEYIIYVKASDKDGNTRYISSEKGIVVDSIAPVFLGIANGGTYHTTQVITVTDKNLESVTLNDAPVTLGNDGKLTLDGNCDKTYAIKVTDKAGNVTEYTVTMKPIADITDSIKDITVDNVTSDDKENIETVIKDIEEELKNDDLTDEEKAELEDEKQKAEDLIKKIEEAIDSTETDNTDKVKDITPDNVKPEDKKDLENAKDDLEKALDDYKDNLTDNEKKDIEKELERIKDALEALNKATTSPAAGDSSHIGLWFALLFVSGGGVLGTTAYRRKRKETEN